MALEDCQFELVDTTGASVVFGNGTPYRVFEFEHGKPDVESNDASLPREDGLRFGRDYMGGVTAGFTLGVQGDDAEDVLNLLRVLRSAWYGTATRTQPGLVDYLRVKRAGAETTRLYGRPRRFTPSSMENVGVGFVPVVMDFQCIDGNFYSDAEYTTRIGIVPPPTGGLVGPLIGPITSEAATEGQGRIDVLGTEPSWLVTKIGGPILNPTIEVVGQWSYTLNLSIAYDMSVSVDPTLWRRTVRTSAGGNVAGKLTQASQRLSRMLLPPGEQTVLLRGTDPTGTAWLDCYHRQVWTGW